MIRYILNEFESVENMKEINVTYVTEKLCRFSWFKINFATDFCNEETKIINDVIYSFKFFNSFVFFNNLNFKLTV